MRTLLVPITGHHSARGLIGPLGADPDADPAFSWLSIRPSDDVRASDSARAGRAIALVDGDGDDDAAHDGCKNLRTISDIPRIGVNVLKDDAAGLVSARIGTPESKPGLAARLPPLKSFKARAHRPARYTIPVDLYSRRRAVVGGERVLEAHELEQGFTAIVERPEEIRLDRKRLVEALERLVRLLKSSNAPPRKMSALTSLRLSDSAFSQAWSASSCRFKPSKIRA
jgi:fermentation-respiration switch protein FrsA (DUF1100 family)